MPSPPALKRKPRSHGWFTFPLDVSIHHACVHGEKNIIAVFARLLVWIVRREFVCVIAICVYVCVNIIAQAQCIWNLSVIYYPQPVNHVS